MDAVAPISPQDEVPGSVPLTATGPGATDLPFGHMVNEGLQSLDAQLKASQVGLQELALGDTQNLHGLMLRLEESRIALHLMLQVRSRVLEAYQDVMKMQL